VDERSLFVVLQITCDLCVCVRAHIEYDSAMDFGYVPVECCGRRTSSVHSHERLAVVLGHCL
jgi:hypothetical protein